MLKSKQAWSRAHYWALRRISFRFRLLSMTSSKLKGTSKTNSRRRQNYGSGSSTVLEFLKNRGVKTVSQTQITKLKALEAARAGPLKPNEDYWEEIQQRDGPSGFDGDDDDALRMTEILEGAASMDDSNVGDWQDIAGGYYRTDTGKRYVLCFTWALTPY